MVLTGLSEQRIVMAFSKTVLGTIFLAAVMLAGCQSSRFGSVYSSPQPSTYEPLTPAPGLGTIEQSQLPPPGSSTATNDPSQFPDAPLGPGQTAPGENPEGTGTGAETASAAGPQLSRDSLVGSWKVSTAGQSCQLFMTLTKWTGGYRAGTRGCPGESANVAAWDLNGNEVVFLDSSGNKVAGVYSSGNAAYSGQTSGGQPILLTR
jgi:hypothetical protein